MTDELFLLMSYLVAGGVSTAIVSVPFSLRGDALSFQATIANVLLWPAMLTYSVLIYCGALIVALVEWIRDDS